MLGQPALQHHGIRCTEHGEFHGNFQPFDKSFDLLIFLDFRFFLPVAIQNLLVKLGVLVDGEHVRADEGGARLIAGCCREPSTFDAASFP